MIQVIDPNVPFSYWKDIVLEGGRKLRVQIRHEGGLPRAVRVKEVDE